MQVSMSGTQSFGKANQLDKSTSSPFGHRNSRSLLLLKSRRRLCPQRICRTSSRKTWSQKPISLLLTTIQLKMRTTDAEVVSIVSIIALYMRISSRKYKILIPF